MNAPTLPSGLAEAPPAGIGHNRPPAFDKAVLAELDTKATDFLKVTKTWLDMPKIETDQHAEQLTDQITGLRGLYKKVDEARKAEKKPHDDAGQEVQDAFNPVLAKLKAAADKLKVKLGDYATAKAEKERAEKAAAAEAARKAQEDAAAALAKAEAENDVSAQVEAERAQKEAEKQAKVAARPVDTSVRSASGAGRTMATRTVKEVKILNLNVVYMHFRDSPEVADVLQRLATAKVRSKDYDPERDPVPGIEVTERKVMA